MKNRFGYDTECVKEDVCDMAVCDGKSCNHYASKAMVENCHSVQQLKAEIAELADEMEGSCYPDHYGMHIETFLSKLRQLSAV